MASTASYCFNIAALIEKMQSPDKDFRFMAVNDIMLQLENDTLKLDNDSERKVVRFILRLLEDPNGEVQNLALKCLGLLVTKVQPVRVERVVEDLCRNMMSANERLRDISHVGLKTVTSRFPLPYRNLTRTISERIVEHLIEAIRTDNVSVEVDALDLLADVLDKCGSAIPSQISSSILKGLISKFGSLREIVRKRAVVVCGVLARYCDSVVYNEIIDHLFSGLSLNFGSSKGRTYVQCVSGVCSQSAQRFGEQTERFLPLILTYSSEEDDDSREYCLQALQVFVQRCPKEIPHHIPSVIDVCLQYLTYDPNYNYDTDEEEQDKGMDTSKQMDEESDQYSDDDDTSWRIRRAAVKCLESIISTRYELLPEFYQTLAPALIARFKERDENVKSDIFKAIISLLRQTKSSPGVGMPSDSEKEEPICLLRKQVPLIVMGVCGQMKEKSIKTRHTSFQLLKVLCSVLPSALASHMKELIPGIRYSLEENNFSSSIKIDAFSFVHCILTSHPPQVFHPHIPALLPPILSAVTNDFYRTAAQALLVLQELVKVMRPLDSVSSFDYTSFVNEIYNCTLTRLKAADTEVKEQAILTMGQIISNYGDFLQDELPVCMPIFLDRLKNEITRLTTIKALTNIAKSVLFVDLPIVNDVIPVLGSLLRQSQRVLKLNTLQLLYHLIKIYYNRINVDLLQHVLVELPPLLSEVDLFVAQWALTVLESITWYHSSALQDMSVNILPEIMKLVKSPFLQGAVQVSMLQFFQGLVKCNLPGLGYNDLLHLLSQPIAQVSTNQNKLHKQVYCSLAKCIAAITAVCKNQALPVVNQIVENMQAAEFDAQHVFSLLVIGEIGREIDLIQVGDVKDIILKFFSAESEDVKRSASYALGGVAIGNLEENLPFILKNMREQPEQQYLLLYSLKEVIVCLSASRDGVEQLFPFIPEIWQQLLPHGESTEEGIRNIVAECLGKSIHINPSNLLPKLQKFLSHHSPLMRATAVTAIKFTIFDKVQVLDVLLQQSIGEFLSKLQDPSVVVRRAALVVLNSAAHNKPSLIRDLLESVLPHLYMATKINQELIQEVEMGPFKHVVDEGLDIRKAAFECMYTLLNCFVDKIDISEFISRVEEGLRDHYDIQMFSYLMVVRLAQLRPIVVLQEMDKLLQPLRTICVLKIRSGAVQQKRERQDELKKSAMRAIKALSSIPDADKNSHLGELIIQIKKSSDLRKMFESCVIEKATFNNHDLLHGC